MNLSEIKNQFRILSGRYDLVDDDSSGVLKTLINQACITLDMLTEHSKSFGSNFTKINAGTYVVSIPLCRTIGEVWIHSANNIKWRLNRKYLNDIVSAYLNGTVSKGSPSHFSPVITRKIPENADLSSMANYLTYLDTQTSLSYGYNAIVIVPPADAEMVIEVRGYYYSRPLEEDTDENYWSSMYPTVLLKAVMRELEVFNQNRSKIESWNAALKVDIDEITKDFVHNLVIDEDQMRNSSI